MGNHTDLSSVVCCAKDQLGSTVVSRANVRHVWLVLDQNLRTSKITQLQDARGGIEQQVLRLDISMTNTLRVNVRQRSEQLVDVEFDLQDRHGCLHLVEVARGSVDRLGDVLEDKVEVDFIFLQEMSGLDRSCGNKWMCSYPFTIGIVEGLQLDDVWVSDNAHDLQLTILETGLVSFVTLQCRRILP